LQWLLLVVVAGVAVLVRGIVAVAEVVAVCSPQIREPVVKEKQFLSASHSHRSGPENKWAKETPNLPLVVGGQEVVVFVVVVLVVGEEGETLQVSPIFVVVVTVVVVVVIA